MKRHSQQAARGGTPPEDLILHRRVRRDRLGMTLLGVSAMTIPLNGIVFPRLARTGGVLQIISTGILFGRGRQFVASSACRQRTVPRLLSVTELIADGAATGFGLWAWAGRPLLEPVMRKRDLHYRRSAGEPRSSQRVSAVALSRAAAVASYTLHTIRLAIYLTPSRGLREGSGRRVPPQKGARNGNDRR